ncbi:MULTISPECIES: GAF domain-containing protein [Aerosakkonema]|uniref:GAF domain-containing protein n=1 Tax=Aerosakkonema TaxID=1246629 RepID=UPI0035BA80DF
MSYHSVPNNFDKNSDPNPTAPYGDPDMRRFADRLAKTLERDALIQQTTDELREFLQVDRVVLYYFYRQWKGQITFESISAKQLSILGSTGPDDCFDDEYAQMYLAGRMRAIADIELDIVNPCHRDYLRSMHVRANLVAPILNSVRLWGLLIAHHCKEARPWSSADIEAIRKGAETLANAPAIRNS